jgi:hypothetical protein
MEYNVIWIDDKCKKQKGFASTFIGNCEKNHGIHIVPFELAVDGILHLEQNIEKIHAVILDAKGWHDKKNVLETTFGMHEAIKRIERLAYKKYVPYYILTAQSDLVNDEEFKNSVGKDKVYYKFNKNHINKLLEQIKNTKNNVRQQIRIFYHDSLDILKSMNINASELLLDILEAIHYPGDNAKFKPVLYYNQLRQILEHIFTEANKYKIIPDECFRNGIVNLDQCYRYLVGQNCEICEIRYGNKGESVVTKHIAEMLSMILYLGNIKSHYTKLNENDSHKLDDYLSDDVGKSHYVIYSLTFQVCEILVWMNEYMKRHQDRIANSQKCKKIVYPKGIIEPIEGVSEFYHIGDRYCIDSELVEKVGVGKHVKIVKSIPNSNKNLNFPSQAIRIVCINGSK